MRELPVAVVALLVLAPAALAQQQHAEPVSRPANAPAEVGLGAEYQTGDYGTGQDVETRAVVASTRLVAGRVVLSASLPYLRVDAPGNVIAGGGGLLGLPIIVDPDQPATRVRRQGLGDMRLGAAWILPLEPLDVAVLGQVKLPTASAGKRLGTGKTDFAVGAEVSKTLGGVTPFANLAYTMPGQPDGYTLRDSFSGQAGVGVRLGGGVSGQLAYGYAQSVSPTLADEQQLSTRLTAGISRKLSVSLYGGAGLSDSAPAASAGVQLGVRLF